MQPLIAPSILAADFNCLGEEIQSVLDAGADVIHFDVMDNHFVPNLSFGPMVLESLRRRFSSAPFDVHLMVEPVEALIDSFCACDATYITIHCEATRHPHAALNRIRSNGVKAGLALNPGTPVSTAYSLIDGIDLLLIMSVNPGFGGQTFIPDALDRVAEARRFVDARGLEVAIEIDGGISADNIGIARRGGADIFVAGSSIFGSADYADVIAKMRSEIESIA